MIVFIDGDSCPVIKNAIKIANNYNLKTIIVKDYNHEMNMEGNNIEIVTVSQGSDSADLYILNNIKKEDILITNDIGLASIALSKKASILNFNGEVINDFNIDFLLLSRHINKQNRKNNIYSSKFKKRTKENNLLFEKSLIKLIENTNEED